MKNIETFNEQKLISFTRLSTENAFGFQNNGKQSEHASYSTVSILNGLKKKWYGTKETTEGNYATTQLDLVGILSHPLVMKNLESI